MKPSARFLDPSELDAYLELHEISHDGRPTGKAAAWRSELSLGRIVGVIERGEVVAGGTTVDATVVVRGRERACAFMGNLVTHPRQRGAGLAEEVLRSQFSDNRDRGHSLACFTVTDSAARLHDRLGSGVVTRSQSFVAQGQGLQGAASSGLRQIGEDASWDEVLQSVALASRSWDGALVPTAGWLRSYFYVNVAHAGRRYFFVDVAPNAGAILSQSEAGLRCELLAAATPSLLTSTVRAVIAQAKEQSVTVDNAPLWLDPVLVAGGAGRVGNGWARRSTWCRILNLPKLWEELGSLATGRVRVLVHDPVLEVNAGTWEFSADGSGATCSASTLGAPDLEVDVSVLSGLLFGSFTAATAAAAGRLVAHTSSGVPTLDSLLAPSRELWSPFTM